MVSPATVKFRLGNYDMFLENGCKIYYRPQTKLREGNVFRGNLPVHREDYIFKGCHAGGCYPQHVSAILSRGAILSKVATLSRGLLSLGGVLSLAGGSMKGRCEGGAVKWVVLLRGFHEGDAMKGGAMTRPPRSVSKRAVCILLECILVEVNLNIFFSFWSFIKKFQP